ncbi:MAG: hypothetical protein ACKOIA_09485 [Acidimicrobiia bacterium]
MRVVLLVALFALLASCGAASDSQSESPSQSATTIPAAPDMRDVRYCEVLLVSIVDAAPVASVYNSYPLNECPVDRWTALDPTALAATYGSTLAILNGPRYWMMNHVEKIGDPASEKTDFGGIEMYKQATVPIGSLIDQARPYSPYSVSRSTVFIYDAGTEVFELVSPDGSTFVMQSYSQQRDPSLTLATLPTLAQRLAPPPGWRFRSRVLSEDLRIVTVSTPARVLQDELGNSYSMIPDPASPTT